MDLPPLPELSGFKPPDMSGLYQDFMDYATGKKRLKRAYSILTLLDFVDWISWTFCPQVEFFPTWRTGRGRESRMCVELKARLSLEKPISPAEAWMCMALPITPALVGLLKEERRSA